MTSNIETLAAFVEELSLERLPAAVISEGKRQVLDALTTMAAGGRVPGGSIPAAVAGALGGAGEAGATVVLTGERVAPANAAFANAQMSIALDLGSNAFFSQGLPGVTIAPALAISEQRQLSGRNLLEAVVAGFEVAGRVALSFPPNPLPSPDGTQIVERDKQPKGRWMVFGGAAAAAKALGLTAEQTADALAISAACAPIVPRRQTYGWGYNSPIKYGLFGAMAWSCVLGGLLAQRGFSGDRLLLEDESGFNGMVGCPLYDAGSYTRELGSRWLILDANFKRYPSGTHNQPALHAFATLLAEYGLQPDEIEQVHVGRSIGVTPAFGNQRPRNYIEAQFSLPFQMAAVGHRVPGHQWHTLLGKPEIESLAGRVQLESDPEAVAAFREAYETQPVRSAWWYRSKVRVKANGRSVEALSNYGTVSDAELAAKCHEYLNELLPAAQVDSLVETVFNLESLDDVGRLTRLMVRPSSLVQGEVHATGRDQQAMLT